MENLTKTEKAMEMLSLFDLPKYNEKAMIAGKLSMSVRQVYRAWERVLEIRKKNQMGVNTLDKWRAYCLWLYKFFTEKWFPDPDKQFSNTEKVLLNKIEVDLLKLEALKLEIGS